MDPHSRNESIRRWLENTQQGVNAINSFARRMLLIELENAVLEWERQPDRTKQDLEDALLGAESKVEALTRMPAFLRVVTWLDASYVLKAGFGDVSDWEELQGQGLAFSVTRRIV